MVAPDRHGYHVLLTYPDLLAARFFAIVTLEVQELVRKPMDLAL